MNRGARATRWGVAAALMASAVGIAAAEITGSRATYPVTAVFTRTPGLFPGAAVEVLGVRVGTVTSIRDQAATVVVGMRIDGGRAIPALAHAALVAPQLLGEPNVDIEPGYAGGARMRPGAVIPKARTSVPVSTSELLKDLQRSLSQINPHAVADLITNLAQDLSGQGQKLNGLIHGAAGTLKLLAAKGNDLGRLDGSLAALTETLRAETSQITSLILDYDTVSGVFASHGVQLGQSVTELADASTQLAALLSPNLRPLNQDVGTIATATRTLDRNVANVIQIVVSADALFVGAQRAYDPVHNWINLSNQLPPGVTGAYVAGLVRDRLAGICRRVLAHHSAGFSSSEITTLRTCGNPSSGFFDPILGLIPGALNALPGGSGPSTPGASPSGAAAASGDAPASGAPAPGSPEAMLQQGLAKIPGLGTAGPSQAAGGSPSGSPSGSHSSGASSQAPGVTSGLGGLLGGLGVRDASAVTGPSLTAPAASLLPAMPSFAAPGQRHHGSHHPRHHGGGLGAIGRFFRGIAHDIWSVL